jgi:hypothetical protein
MTRSEPKYVKVMTLAPLSAENRGRQARVKATKE